MVQLHYCQNHSVCISVPQSPKSWQQTASPLMLQDKYWTGLHATKASRAALLQPNQAQPVCLGKCVSEWTRSNCFSRLWGRKGKSVCLHTSFLNLKWAFIVLGLHFRNHPFSNSDGWCQEIWGGLSHFFPQCKFQMEAMQIFLARMLLISLLQNLSLLYYTLWSSLLTGHFIHC